MTTARPMFRALALILLVAAGGRAQEDPLPEGPALRVTGVGEVPERYRGKPQGRLMAERAARTAAVRNLAAAVTGYLETQDGTETEIVVDAFIKGFVVTRTTHRADGSVEVEVGLPIEQIARNFRTTIAEAERLRLDLLRARDEEEKVRKMLEATQKRLEEIRRIVGGG